MFGYWKGLPCGRQTFPTPPHAPRTAWACRDLNGNLLHRLNKLSHLPVLGCSPTTCRSGEDYEYGDNDRAGTSGMTVVRMAVLIADVQLGKAEER